MPDAGTVRPEVTEPRGRVREVVRLGDLEEHSSEHAGKIVKVCESLERDPPGRQEGRKAVAGEDARRGLSDASIGETVADVGEAIELDKVRSLALRPADGAGLLFAKERPPPLGPRVEPERGSR